MALINFFYASNAILVSLRAAVIWKLDTCFHQGIITYLLLTEFEVRIASYEPSFSTWPITARVLFICRVNPRRSGIYFLPTVQDFADISDNCQKSVPDLALFFGGRETTTGNASAVRRLSQILPKLNLAGNGLCAKNWNLYTNVW